MKSNKYKNCLIDFHTEDARLVLKYLNKQYDIVFLDAYSPQKDPSLWTVDFLNLVKSKMHFNSVLLSYSKSSPFRSALLKLGFFVGKTYIDKVDMGTVASLSSDKIKNPLKDFDYELLSTTAGITFKDPLLSLNKEDIIKNRDFEISSSDLISHTAFLKKFKK